jgi:hypothetical protein
MENSSSLLLSPVAPQIMTRAKTSPRRQFLASRLKWNPFARSLFSAETRGSNASNSFCGNSVLTVRMATSNIHGSPSAKMPIHLASRLPIGMRCFVLWLCANSWHPQDAMTYSSAEWRRFKAAVQRSMAIIAAHFTDARADQPMLPKLFVCFSVSLP